MKNNLGLIFRQNSLISKKLLGFKTKYLFNLNIIFIYIYIYI